MCRITIKKNQMLNNLALKYSYIRSNKYNKNDMNGYAYIGAILFDKKYHVLCSRYELLQS